MNRRLQLGRGCGIDEHGVRRLETATLLEQLASVAMRTECDDAKSIRMTRDYIERVIADGAR
jgi:hypothetical protein